MADTIKMTSQGLSVPNNPIIPFIEGDGIGPDIWAASVRVFDAAVAKAYGGQRKIEWREVLAGEKAFEKTGSWLPPETLTVFRDQLVGIKGPLTTPVGGGIRSLNVALRQELDLYVCLRPVRWFEGVPSPVKRPQDTNMVIFRENTEDIYAGIEFQAGTPDGNKFRDLLKDNFPKPFTKVRFPNSAGFGIKPVSQEGTERLVRAALKEALPRPWIFRPAVAIGQMMRPLLPQVLADKVPTAAAGHLATPQLKHLAAWERRTSVEIDPRTGEPVQDVRFSLDEACYADYAAALLPEIGRYAQLALDYLFRGELKLTLTTTPESRSLVVQVAETALGSGTLTLLGDKPEGLRQLLSTQPTVPTRPGSTLWTVQLSERDTKDLRRLVVLFRGRDRHNEPLITSAQVLLPTRERAPASTPDSPAESKPGPESETTPAASSD